MLVEIDTERLHELSLTPNDYVALLLRSVEIPCDYPINLTGLQKEGYIKITDVGFDLRPRGRELFSAPKSADILDWIDSYRELFPKGRTPDGYPYKGDKEGCIRKMKAFMKKYPYSKEEILEATVGFVEAKRKKNFEFMTLAHYFIEKEGVSLLAALCAANRDREFGAVELEDNHEDI